MPTDYVLFNFNDFESSLGTLFTLMMVNNWNTLSMQFVKVSDGNTNVLLFFVCFYFASVVIVFNVIIAVILDMHASVERLDK